jgi:hypothetical protein
MEWTKEKVQTLRQLWSQNKTFYEIGAAMKCSRNCIAGKVHRLGLKRREPRTNKTLRGAAELAAAWVKQEKHRDIATLEQMAWNECYPGSAVADAMAHRLRALVSDREWKLIATGETPLKALQGAMSAKARKP